MGHRQIHDLHARQMRCCPFQTPFVSTASHPLPGRQVPILIWLQRGPLFRAIGPPFKQSDNDRLGMHVQEEDSKTISYLQRHKYSTRISISHILVCFAMTITTTCWSILHPHMSCRFCSFTLLYELPFQFIYTPPV